MTTTWVSRKLYTAIALVILAAFTLPVVAFASSVDVAVVDVTTPTNSVTLAPGGSASITLNMTVTGNQAGTATFEVYRDWVLSDGVFTGSNPQEFTVLARTSSDPANTFSTSGLISVAAGQADGPITLAVGAFDITNSNSTGAKLAVGSSSNYQVTVETPVVLPPSDTTPPVIANRGDEIVVATSALGAVVNYTSPATSDNVDAPGTATCLPASGSQFSLGSTTVTCNATDAAGNPAVATTFKVIVTYADSGVLQPINQDGSSVFKAGSTVPVKFQLTGASAGIVDAAATIQVAKFTNAVLGSEYEDVSTTSTSAASVGNAFRYDATSDQYIFNLNTKNLTGQGSYRITIHLGDGDPIVVNFSLKK